ncbi:MAG: hypothetical protein M3Z04_00605 [Chloroflexota bacterium]|nr:hypothetical protein [Chloroflexota bacterium]
MIPVTLQPEPVDFDAKVRIPGNKFLLRAPAPINWKKEGKGKEFWTRELDDLYKLYGGICAYCAHWIPKDVGSPSVDHFKNKAKYPHLAYEWSNYRFAALRYNRNKGISEEVLDPFIVQPGWFILDMPSLLIKCNLILAPSLITKIEYTINRLKLNDETSRKSRQRWVDGFKDGSYSFSHLEQRAPFIAYEFNRQGLNSVTSLAQVYYYPRH